MSDVALAIDPEELLDELLGFDPDLRPEAYYGERSVFYNPGRKAPLGVIFASVKDRDGPNDSAARLSRPGVYRLAFGLSPARFEERFGGIPPRPLKGVAVSLPGHDLTRLNELAPHPVYAWMSWVQVLSPSTGCFESLRPLLAESLDLVRGKWERRRAHDPD